MGIFDFFNKKPEPTAETAAKLAEARASLAGGDATAAWRTVRGVFAHPAVLSDVDLAASLAVFADVARRIAGDDFADKIAALAKKLDDVELLYAVGYDAYEHQIFDVAATVLLRANRLQPGSARIVSEAAGALENMLRYDEAATLLDASGLAEREPICIYLHGYCSLMTGRRDPAAAAVDRLNGVSTEPFVGMRRLLAAMVARTDALASQLDDAALTAWHMALNGTLLLHESPHGYPTPMRGRCALIGDSAGLMRQGLTRLRDVVDVVPARIVHGPDRASRILGLAAAQLFDRPAAPWCAGTSLDNALVVVWTLDAAGDASFTSALSAHEPGQLLYAHGSDWVNPFPFAPDVTTVLYQTMMHPWTGGALIFDEKTGTRSAEPDTRSDEVLAAAIVAGAESDDSMSKLELVRSVRDAVRGLRDEDAAGMFRTSGLRARQRAGSVVPSARFL